jgi:hypothetical protein
LQTGISHVGHPFYTPSLVEDLSPLCAAGQTNGEYFALMREAIERRLRLL